MKLAVLALEGCMHSAISGVADVLSLANHVMQQSGAKSRFTWQTLSLDGKAVRAGGGQTVAVDGAIGKRAGFDVILVPGSLVDHVTAERLQPQYARAGAWLRQQHANGRLIGAFCSGVFCELIQIFHFKREVSQIGADNNRAAPIEFAYLNFLIAPWCF